MEPVLCDCKGCRRPAAWVRSEEIASPRAGFLCQECWEGLQANRSEQAGDYVAYRIHTTPVRRFFRPEKPGRER